MSIEIINRSRRLGMTHVPYRGAGPGMTALLSNEVQLYLGGAGLGVQHVQSGRVRALAVSGRARLPQMPDIPTFDEAGLNDVQARNWWGLAAPAGTPPAVLAQLNEAVRRVLDTPSVRAGFAKLGVIGVANSREDMARQWADEARAWSRMVKETGITIE